MRNWKGLNVKLKGLIPWGVFLGLLTSPQMKWAVKQTKQLPVLWAVVGNCGISSFRFFCGGLAVLGCGVSRLWWRDNRNPSEEQNLLTIVQVPVALTSSPNSVKPRLKPVGWYQSRLSAEQGMEIISLLFWNIYSGFKYFHSQTTEKPDWIRLAVSYTVIKISSLRLKIK